MSYPINLRFLMGKLESSPGTVETLTSADFNSRIINPELTFNTEVDSDDAKYARGDHAESESVYGARSAQVTFDIRMSWGGGLTTEPDYWKFLNACGLKSVTYTDTGIALQPLKEKDETTMTLEIYDVGRGATPTAVKTQLGGCMGNVVITCEKIGAPWLAKITMTGKLIGQSTIANVDIPYPTDMDQLHPEKFIANSIYIDGKAVKVSKFALDVGNDIQPVFNQADPTGYSHFAVASRKPRLSCDPLMEALTVDDPIGDVVAGCTGLYAVDPIVIKSNRFRLKAPRAQLLPVGIANREGLINWDKNYKLMNNGYTGMQGDTGLPTECTWELLQGFHETGIAWSDTGMYM